jgi:hypothetical protein
MLEWSGMSWRWPHVPSFNGGSLSILSASAFWRRRNEPRGKKKCHNIHFLSSCHFFFFVVSSKQKKVWVNETNEE